MKKKVMIWLLASVLLLSGCGGSGAESDKGSKDSQVSSENKSEADSNSLEDLNATKDLKDSLSELNWFYNVDGENDVWRVRIKTFENNLKGYSRSKIHLSGDTLNPIQTMSFEYKENEKEGTFTIGLYDIDETEKQEWIDMYKNAFSDFVCEEETYNGYKITTHNKTNDIEAYKFLEGQYAFNITLEKAEFEDGLENYKNYLHNLIDAMQVQQYSVSDFKNTSYLEKLDEDEDTRALYLSSKEVEIEDKFELDLSDCCIGDFNTGGYVWMDEEEIIYSIKASKHTEYLNVEIWLLDKDAETLNKLLTEVGTEVNEVEIEGIKFTEVKNLYDTFHIYDGESGSYVISVHSDLEEGLAEIMNVK